MLSSQIWRTYCSHGYGRHMIHEPPRFPRLELPEVPGFGRLGRIQTPVLSGTVVPGVEGARINQRLCVVKGGGPAFK